MAADGDTTCLNPKTVADTFVFPPDLFVCPFTVLLLLYFGDLVDGDLFLA